MTDQLTLTGETEGPAISLTARQRYALETIEKLGPIPSDELGAWMHERRGKHDAGVRCQWCGDDGKGIGKELRRKGLVKQRRGEGWVRVGKPAQAREGEYDPSTSVIPF